MHYDSQSILEINWIESQEGTLETQSRARVSSYPFDSQETVDDQDSLLMNPQFDEMLDGDARPAERPANMSRRDEECHWENLQVSRDVPEK